MKEGKSATVERSCGLSEDRRFHSVEESSFSSRVIGNVDDILITVTKKKTPGKFEYKILTASEEPSLQDCRKSCFHIAAVRSLEKS